ncbi:hypothetical protein V6N12_073720 [Hibiscus sabdariffa]|uniref:Uncharacterized protein n=1 Tax=Hibiscus sabdariffa TaxID=183260 RepID=A0ABR2CT93_9ROSI
MGCNVQNAHLDFRAKEVRAREGAEQPPPSVTPCPGLKNTGQTKSLISSAMKTPYLGSKSSLAMATCPISYYPGIDVVWNKIKMFAQKKVTLPPGRGRHKIVILDEADSPVRMTSYTWDHNIVSCFF